MQDIWECISAIEDYTKTLSEEEFFRNRQTQDAVVRRLEIIGETVKNIDEETRIKFSDIPWKKMAGMRDVLIHQYFGVRMKRVWETVKSDIPSLKLHLRAMIEKENS